MLVNNHYDSLPYENKVDFEKRKDVENLKMPLMTVGQILATDPDNRLMERYFEIVFNEGEPDQQLAVEIFQAFRSLPLIRFGNTVFTRGEIL